MKKYLSDFLLLVGLTQLGTGLYLKFDIGVSLSVVGGLVLIAGYKMAHVKGK